MRCERRKRLRSEIYEEQGGKCIWCGKLMTKNQATLEHLKAQALGGTDDRFNLAVACRKCNGDRGGRLSKELHEIKKLKEAKERFVSHRPRFAKKKPDRILGRKRVVDRVPPANYLRRKLKEMDADVE